MRFSRVFRFIGGRFTCLGSLECYQHMFEWNLL
jgi:hypothetical protein